MNKKLYWALIAVFSVIFLVSAFFVADYLIDAYKAHKLQQQLEQTQPNRPTVSLRPTENATVGTTGGINLPSLPGITDSTDTVTRPSNAEETAPNGMLADMYDLYQLNNDVVGYIYIEDTRINYPVLHRPEERDYYLRRDFYGNSNDNGSIYVREACDVFAPSDNVTIYGHNMVTGMMFADIHKYKEKDFFDSHPLVYFDTLYERHVYQVFCLMYAYVGSDSDFFFHTYDDFTNESTFKSFVRGVRSQAIYDSGISVNYGDKFISLCTCIGGNDSPYRLVLVAVRIS